MDINNPSKTFLNNKDTCLRSRDMPHLNRDIMTISRGIVPHHTVLLDMEHRMLYISKLL